MNLRPKNDIQRATLRFFLTADTRYLDEAIRLQNKRFDLHDMNDALEMATKIMELERKAKEAFYNSPAERAKRIAREKADVQLQAEMKRASTIVKNARTAKRVRRWE